LRGVKRAFSALALLSVFCARSASSQDARIPTSEPPTIGLTALLREARHKLPAVLAALATLRRVQAEQALAEAAYLPRLTAEASLSGLYDNRRLTPDVRVNSGGLAATAAFNFDWAAVDPARKGAVESARSASAAQSAGVEASERTALIAAV
jgi:outer membrane protein TolC